MTYRVFVEDVGRGKFSGVDDAEADNPREAILKATRVDDSGRQSLTWFGKRLIALPHGRKDLWPNGTTGIVPREALTFR